MIQCFDSITLDLTPFNVGVFLSQAQGIVYERRRERVGGEEQNISFLVVARAAALRPAERRPAPRQNRPFSALAVILHFGFVNLYLKLHAHTSVSV